MSTKDVMNAAAPAAQPEPVAQIAPDPACPYCRGTGIDGDCRPDGSVMDVDCMCLFRTISLLGRRSELTTAQIEALPRKLLDVACRVRTNETLVRDDELIDDACHALNDALDEIARLKSDNERLTAAPPPAAQSDEARDAIYAAWRAVGADVAGLDWHKFSAAMDAALAQKGQP